MEECGGESNWEKKVDLKASSGEQACRTGCLLIFFQVCVSNAFSVCLFLISDCMFGAC